MTLITIKMGGSELYDGEESSEEDDQASSRQDIWAEDELYDVALMLPSRESEFLNVIEQSEERDEYENLSGVTLAVQTEESSNLNIDLSDSDSNAIRDAMHSMEDYETGEFEWYDDPYGEDFIHDFSLVEDMWSPEKGWFRWAMIEDWDQNNENDWLRLLKKKASLSYTPLTPEEQMTDDEYSLHFNIMDAIDLIKTPGKSKEGIKSLSDIMKGNVVDLDSYLADLDYCLVRYIIWGLNFYHNQDDFYTWEDPKELLPPFEYRLMSMTTKMSIHSIGEINVNYWSMILNWFMKKTYDSRFSTVEIDADFESPIQSFFGTNQQPIDQY